MEYLIGSLLTFIIMVVAAVLSRRREEPPVPWVKYSQTHIHQLIGPYLPSNRAMLPQQKTQSSKHVESMYVRVVFLDNKAYFIKDNVFYEADVVDGDVDKASAKQVDTMAMDAIQLNKIKFIVAKLTEGKDNDSGDSR